MSDTLDFSSPSYKKGVVERLTVTQVQPGFDSDDYIEVNFLLGQDLFTAYANPKVWKLRDLEWCVEEDLLFFSGGEVLPLSLQPEEIKQKIKDMNEFTSRFKEHRKRLDNNVLISSIHKCRKKLANWVKPEFS